MESNPPPVLAYAADLPIRYGISYNVQGPNARIAVPESSNPWYRITALAFLVYLALHGIYQIVMPVVAIVSVGQDPDLSGLLCSGSFGAVFVAGAAQGFRVWLRAPKQQTVIELDGERLTISDFDDNGKPRRRWWHRRDILDIRPGPVPWTEPEIHGLGLHIRIARKTILEVMPGHPRKVAQWVSDQLTGALSVPVASALTEPRP